MSPPGVLVVKGAERFELADEIRVTPAPKLCGTSGRFLRCLSIRRGTSLLTDIDTASHVIERRIDKLPTMHRLWFHPSGCCLGYRKSGRIGNPSDLFFLDRSGFLMKSVRLPDAISDVEADLGAWYVSCRDSRLYAFETTGMLLWRRRVRVPAPYSITGMFLPATAPYLHVSAGGGLVGIGANRRFFVLDGLGNLRWHTKLRPEPGLHKVMWGPTDAPVRATLLERLGLGSRSNCENVGTGFIRLAFEKAGGTFVRALEHYDTSGCADEEGPSGLEVVTFGAGSAGITAVGMAESRIALGTGEGNLELFNREGTHVAMFRVGEAPVSAIAMDYGQLRATYAGGLLTMFDDGRITGFVQMPEYFAALAPCGSEMLVWRWKEAWVMNRKGRVIWRASFAKRISSVVPGSLGFQVLAGTLFWFQRQCE